MCAYKKDFLAIQNYIFVFLPGNILHYNDKDRRVLGKKQLIVFSIFRFWYKIKNTTYILMVYFILWSFSNKEIYAPN